MYQVLGGAAPDRIAEINGNEALVSRCRLLARAPSTLTVTLTLALTLALTL